MAGLQADGFAKATDVGSLNTSYYNRLIHRLVCTLLKAKLIFNIIIQPTTGQVLTCTLIRIREKQVP